MSLAREHREHMAGKLSAGIKAASGVTVSAAKTASGNSPAGGTVRTGGPSASFSLVRQHIERCAARKIAQALSVQTANVAAPTAAPDKTAGVAVTAPVVTDPAAAQVYMRFQADMQRLHAIKSIRSKIEAKRKLLPDYTAFCDGMMEAAAPGDRVADDILATVMVWRIDTADYTGALTIAEYMLAKMLAMPARYQRDAATTITEEIADAALRDLAEKMPFDLDILLLTEDMMAKADMPDEVRAKLHKAIGMELFRQANTEGATEPEALLTQAAEALRKAQGLDGQCGVKKYLERIERALKLLNAAKAQTAT